jgi:hypothetical protein
MTNESHPREVYRILAWGLNPPCDGKFVRVDDFEDDETTQEEAQAVFNEIKESGYVHNGVRVRYGTRLLLVSQLDWYEGTYRGDA